MYKLQKFTCHYNLKKILILFKSSKYMEWNSLPNEVLEVYTVNIIKNRLDK